MARIRCSIVLTIHLVKESCCIFRYVFIISNFYMLDIHGNRSSIWNCIYIVRKFPEFLFYFIFSEVSTAFKVSEVFTGFLVALILYAGCSTEAALFSFHFSRRASW